MRSFWTVCANLIHLVHTFAYRMCDAIYRLSVTFGPLKWNTSIYWTRIELFSRIQYRNKERRNRGSILNERRRYMAHDTDKNGPNRLHDYNQSMVHRIFSTPANSNNRTERKQNRNKTPTVFTHIQTTNRFSRDSSVFVRIRVSCVFKNDAIFAHFKLWLLCWHCHFV